VLVTRTLNMFRCLNYVCEETPAREVREIHLVLHITQAYHSTVGCPLSRLELPSGQVRAQA
jgi:hypothetical protein